MKKFFLLVSIVIIILTVSACTAESNNDSVNDNLQGSCKQSAFINSNSDLAIAPDGYYSLNGENEDMYVTYISKGNAKETYLCSKPECSHVDDTGFHGLASCNAYVGLVIRQSIVYDNGYIYVLKYDRETYDVTLCKISADGSVHEEIMVVGQTPNNGSYYRYVFANDHTILMVYDEPDYTGDERTISLDKIDLNKKEKTSIYTYTGEGASIAYLKVMNDNVFFTEVQRQDDYYIYKLMKYDLKENRVDTVLESNIGSYTLADNGQLFYFIPKDGLYRCDLQTMKSKKIRECDEETMYVSLAYDGTYIYMDNLINRFYYNEDSGREIFVCDAEGKLINTISKAYVISLELTDKDYMFIQSFSDKDPYWSYIKKSDITNPSVAWSAVEK